jgi:hypothetical protein
MQVDDAVQELSPIPRRRRLGVLLAIVVIAALVVWVVPLATSGVRAQDAIPKAGADSALIHDDAVSILPSAGSAVLHDDAGSLAAN